MCAWKGSTMTRLFVDQQEIAPVPKSICSLDQILKHVEDSHLEPDTIIRQVHVDGRPLLCGEVDPEVATMAGPRLANARVEIFTGRLSAIALESVNEAEIYLTRMEAAIPSLAMGLRSDPGPGSFEALKQFCDGFFWLNLLLEKVDARGNREIGSDPAAGLEGPRLVSVLNELVQAQGRKDFILVADILEYEILELLPGYRTQFLEVRQRLQNEVSG